MKHKKDTNARDHQAHEEPPAPPLGESINTLEAPQHADHSGKEE